MMSVIGEHVFDGSGRRTIDTAIAAAAAGNPYTLTPPESEFS